MNKTAELAGWPTARAEDAESSGARLSRGVADTLTAVAKLTGWATPQRHDAQGGKTPEQVEAMKARGYGVANLNEQVNLTGLVSPASRDYKDTPGMSETGTNPDGSTRSRVDQLPRQVHGLIQSQSPALMAARAGFRLNPAMSRWLMGFPSSWDRCSPGWDDWDAMQRLLREWHAWLAETEQDDFAATATR